MGDEVRTYVVLESFAVRSGVQALPGEEVRLTDEEAKRFLHYGRIRPKVAGEPTAPAGGPDGSPEVQSRDPKATRRT